MNDDRNLDPDVKALLTADPEDAPRADAKARIAAALAASVPLFPANSTIATSSPPAAHLSNPAAMSATRAYAMTAVAFVIGAAAGAAGLAILRPPAKPASTIVQMSTLDAGAADDSPVLSVPMTTHPEDATSSATDAADAAARVAHLDNAADASSGATDLAAERALLDEARVAMTQGNTTDAMHALDRHRTRFPHGQLGEEREALAIDVLARTNRRAEAERRATTFRARSPNSLFLPMIDAALAHESGLRDGSDAAAQ